MEKELQQSWLDILLNGPWWLAIIIGPIVVLFLVAKTGNPIIDFLQKIGAWKKTDSSAKTPSDYRAELVAGVLAGTITADKAIELAYALADERYENAPPPLEELPTGPEPVDEFIRKFVRLATSRNEREREAAALDAEGKTEEALALLETLAEEESQQAAERWKARGAMAYNAFTAKAIESYARAVGANPNDADARTRLGHLYRRTGDLDRAKAAYEKVLSLGNQSADQVMQAVAYGNLGVIAQTRGDLDGAEAYLKQSLALNEELGSKEGMAAVYGNLGLIAQMRGDLDGAEAYHKQSLAIEEGLGRKEGMAADYNNLGALEIDRSNMDAAIAYWRKSHALYTEIGMLHMVEKVARRLRDVGAPVEGDTE